MDTRDHVRRLERFRHFLAQLRQDGFRRLGRSHETIPGRGVEAGKALLATVGSAAGRLAPAFASAHLAGGDLRQHHRHEIEEHLDVSTDEIIHRRSRAAIRHMHDVDLRHALEQLAGQMIGGAVARRGEVDLARLLFRQRDQFPHILGRYCGIDDQHDRRSREQCDGREIRGRIERELAVERLIDGERPGRGEQQGVAVRLRLGDEIAAGVSAAAGAVLDDELLAEIVTEFLRQDARHHVHRSPGRSTD